MVGGGNNWGNVLIGSSLVLGVSEVVHNTPGDDTLPVLLQENIPGGVDQEQTMNHSAVWSLQLHDAVYNEWKDWIFQH